MKLPTPAATRALGATLGGRLFPGAVVCLVGDLGAGKTCLTQGLAAGLGVAGVVTSPTYILVAEYPEARVPLRHADLYRVESAEALAALGIEERVGRDGAWVVEWGDRFPDLFPADHLRVELSHDGDTRVASLVATGPRHAALIEGIDGA